MVGQIFRTGTVANLSPCFYQLSIRQPGGFFSEFATYTFPLSPSALRTERNALSSYVDTQGPALTQGVTRVVDTYGLSPPIFTIEGTTGWDTHLTDGNFLPGMQSMQLLQAFLQRYASLNQGQRAAGNSDMYQLEFYDYFMSQFWVVEPVGPQIMRQDNARPLLSFYRFRWAAVKPVGLPLLGEADALLQVFGTPASRAVVNAASTVTAIIAAYSIAGSPIGSLSSALGINLQ